jgi:hypothetical protein
VQAVLRAAQRLPQPEFPPREHAVWWERGLLDGVETVKVFAQEAFAAVDDVAAAAGATAVRAAVAELAPLFATDGPRRADGRLDEIWIQHLHVESPEEE